MSETRLQRVAAGDGAAMRECIDAYSGLVWALARRLSASPAEAEDGVQDVFISLWENAGRFDPEKGAEVTFVAMIARRRLIDRGRSAERRERLHAAKAELDAPREDAPESVVDVEDVRKALEAFESLSESRREVLGLAIHKGCTHEQISTITGMPLGTVKTHARRGLMQVREMLSAGKSSSEVAS